MTWTLGLGLSCLLGLVIGIAVRPYIIPNTERYQSLPLHRDMEALPNQSGEASYRCCSSAPKAQLLAAVAPLIRINIVTPRPHLESVSLLDLDVCNSGEVTKPGKYYDQLKDLMSFDEDSTNGKATFNKGNDSLGRRNVCHEGDLFMIRANMGFVEPPIDNILHQESSVCNLGIVKCNEVICRR
ncbi:hypothetical protein JHK84_050168 [Glycine max]|nr:hypothetical protein JHK84_050168 [Glycine max]